MQLEPNLVTKITEKAEEVRQILIRIETSLENAKNGI